MTLSRDSGLVLGGIGLTAVTTAYHALFFGAALNDGQYGMVWMFTVPAGAALGWAAQDAWSTRSDVSARIKSCLVGCLLVLFPVVLYLLQTVSNSQRVSSTPAGTVFLEAILFALPTILCVLALAARGLFLRRGESSN